MVDGVNFNPFTNKVWTTEEIEKIATDKNGTVSYAEMQANISWLTGSVDEEGEVLIGEESSSSVTLSDNESKIYNAAAKNGVQNQAADASQLQQYMNTIIDSYIEQYMQKNPGLDQNQKSSLITFIKTQGQEFVNSYLQNNTAVPYNTQSVAQSLIQTLDSAVQQRNDLATDVNNQINDYKNNVDANYDKLSATTDKADDDYVTSAEFQQMKDEAIAYLMGTMLNGAEDSEFLAGLNPNYKNDANYKIAMAAINSINNETDPAKIQEYLEQAKNALSNLIGTQNVDGTSKLNNTVISSDASKAEAAKAAQTAEYTETLTATIDDMVEAYSNQNKKNPPSESAVNFYNTQLKAYMAEFVNQYEGDGTDIEAQFKEYVQNIQNEFNDVMEELSDLKLGGGKIANWLTGKTDVYGSLVDSVNDAGTYVNEEEKEEIISKASDLFLLAIRGNSDATVYEIYPNFESDSNYLAAVELYKGLGTSVHPKEDLAKMKELLTTMLQNRGIDNIINGVKTQESKNVDLEVGGEWLNGIIGYNSDNTVGGDSINYFNFTTDQDGNIQWLNNGDRANNETIMNQLSERIHEKMKEQLGDMYDEDTINVYFKQALQEALVSLGDLSGTREVSEVVDMIVRKFNEIATNGLHDRKSNEFSRTEVIIESGTSQDYSSATTINASLSIKVTKEAAKNQLERLRAALINQAKIVLGDNFNNTDINILIDDSINETVDSYSFERGRVALMLIHRFNCNDLYNNFFDIFEDKLDDYKKSKE